jgi:hypothetical protein
MGIKVIASTATLDGVVTPVEAQCNICLGRWQRPDDDPGADSLADFAHHHAVAHGARYE